MNLITILKKEKSQTRLKKILVTPNQNISTQYFLKDTVFTISLQFNNSQKIKYTSKN